MEDYHQFLELDAAQLLSLPVEERFTSVTLHAAVKVEQSCPTRGMRLCLSV